mgnify:FL=1
MIKCGFRKTSEFGALLPSWNKNKKKLGKYHGSNFYNIKGFGTKKWVVVAKIDVDYEPHLSEGRTQEEVVAGCLEYLNQVPPRKKYAKKKPVAPYGKLECHRAIFNRDEEGSYIQALLIIDKRKNKLFWGEGQKLMHKRRKRRTE